MSATPFLLRTRLSALIAGMLLMGCGVTLGQTRPQPHGLMCDLLPRSGPEAPIRDRSPSFSWIVPQMDGRTTQKAYHLQVWPTDQAQTNGHPAAPGREETLTWDSGWVNTAESASVPYDGPPLKPDHTYAWRVRVRADDGTQSAWSHPQALHVAAKEKLTDHYTVSRLPLRLASVPAHRVEQVGEDHWFVDFEKAAFGTLRLHVPDPQPGKTLTIHLGEKLAQPRRVDRKPGGTIRYRKTTITLKQGVHDYTVQLEPDERNTGPNAIKIPDRFPTVMPFRYAEIEGLSEKPSSLHLKQLRLHYPFDDEAAAFASSNSTLNAVRDLSHYSLKATSFAGVYVDGDRERIPYEADAYINQLCHYGVDRSFAMGRYSHEYLLHNPTWPTEWHLHSVMMAWQDYLHTGDLDSVQRHYDTLKAKTLKTLAREDGLISTRDDGVPRSVLKAIHMDGEIRDIVDWPRGERDGYKFTKYNTVVNAFHLHTLKLMAKLAEATGRDADAAMFRQRREKTLASFQDAFFDESRGLYTDGESTDHVSLHANMFPLALGLVPEQHMGSVVEYVKSRGMACSVYGAQYLLRGLYRHGAPEAALKLMTSRRTRSWWNMIRVRSTITLEAWDRQFKPNLDWNHAWGAAPANIVPRYVLGVRPMEPGFRKTRIAPQPATLNHAEGRVPTIRGPIHVAYNATDAGYRLVIDLPANTPAHVLLPEAANAKRITQNGAVVSDVKTKGARAVIGAVPPGRHVFRVVQ